VGETERGAVTERVPSAVGASKPEPRFIESEAPHPEPAVVREIREHQDWLREHGGVAGDQDELDFLEAWDVLVGRCRAASATCADLSARLEQAEEEIQRLKTLEADEE
jgi:hypothetical protein